MEARNPGERLLKMCKMVLAWLRVVEVDINRSTGAHTVQGHALIGSDIATGNFKVFGLNSCRMELLLLRQENFRNRKTGKATKKSGFVELEIF